MIRNVAIVSLSSGTIGESFVKHEIELGLRRMKDMGLSVRFMPNAQKGIAYLQEHPEKRAEDLLEAFRDDSIDMILCAIGGDDTYRLLPYLFEHNVLKSALKNKVFLGFSDTTMNHLMLHKLGLNTFYGQSFLADVCELDREMLPYSMVYFSELIRTGMIAKVTPSDVWYDERTDWSADALGTPRVSHPNSGFQLLQGPSVFKGKILGGCLNTIYDIFDSGRYPDSVFVCGKYGIFPDEKEWKGKILLLETSEEQPSPQLYEKMLRKLKDAGVFNAVSGILCGKPMNEKYFDEYNRIIVEVADDPTLPIIANINIGHSVPRCIIPFGVDASVDAEKQEIVFHY